MSNFQNWILVSITGNSILLLMIILHLWGKISYLTYLMEHLREDVFDIQRNINK